MFKWLILGLFGIGFLWTGSMGAGTDMAYVWPGLLIFGFCGCVTAFARSGKCRMPDTGCMVLFTALFAYFTVRAVHSPVTYSARSDLCLLIAASLVYLVFSVFLTSAASRKFVIWVFIVVAFGNIAVALYQFAVDAGFHIRPNESREGRVLGVTPSGFYFTHDHMAGFLEVVAIFTLSLGVLSSAGAGMKRFYILTGILCLAGVTLSMSRGGFLSLTAGLLVLGFLIVWRIRRTGNTSSGKLPRVMAAVFGFFLIVSMAMIAKRFQHSSDAKVVDFENDIRFTNWSLAVEQWKMSPVFGLGSRMYDPYSVQLWPEEASRESGHPVFAHNDYLQVLAEYGIIGLLLVLLFTAFHLVNGLRLCAREVDGLRNNTVALRFGALGCLAAYAVHSCFDFNLHLVSNAVPVALCFAILSDSRRKAAVSERGFALFGAKAFAVGMGGWLLIAGAKVTPAEYHRVRMEHAIDSGDYLNAVVHGKKAIDLDPENFLARRFLGFAWFRESLQYDIPQLRHSFVQKALSAYLECVEINPWDIISHTGIGRCHSELGESEKAVKAFRQASELGPFEFDPFLYLAYHYTNEGTKLLELGEVKEGLLVLERALEAYRGAARADYTRIKPVSVVNDNYMDFLRFMAELYASRASFYEGIGDAAVEEGDIAAAEESYQQSIEFMKKEWALLLPAVLPETVRRAERLKPYMDSEN